MSDQPQPTGEAHAAQPQATTNSQSGSSGTIPEPMETSDPVEVLQPEQSAANAATTTQPTTNNAEATRTEHAKSPDPEDVDKEPKKLDVASPAYTRSKRKRIEDAAAAAKSNDTVTNDANKRPKTLEDNTSNVQKQSAENENKEAEEVTSAFSKEEKLESHATTTSMDDGSKADKVGSAEKELMTTQSKPSKSPQDDHYVETYVELANRMVFTMDPSTRQMLQELDLPTGGAVSGLGYLKGVLRRPATVLERWSPYEIALFQASVAHYGKQFERVQKEIGSSKTVQDVIDFYYIWKKTRHYQAWKKEYLPPHLDVDDEVDAAMEENHHKNNNRK